jgi:hypothetical protein
MTYAKADIDRLDAERQREHERVLELEHQLAVVSALRRDERAAFDRKIAAYSAAARAASKEVLVALPAHLVDLAGLRDAEREIRHAMRWAPDPVPDRVVWFVPTRSRDPVGRGGHRPQGWSAGVTSAIPGVSGR